MEITLLLEFTQLQQLRDWLLENHASAKECWVVMSRSKNPIGVLHDVVEDTDWTFEGLAAEGFSEEVIVALRGVTKTSENENYDDFIERVKKNPLATAVKINDLTDNMDIRRLPYLSDKDVNRLKKYLKAHKKLISEPVYSIYAARQENPNAYDPWTEEADAELKSM